MTPAECGYDHATKIPVLWLRYVTGAKY